MKWVFGIGGLFGGAIVVFLLFHLGVMDFADGVPGVQQEPTFTLPTYLSFIGVMLTAVTVVLAAVAIGIGVVAAYTIQEIRERAESTVEAAKQQAETAKSEALSLVNGAVDQALSEEALNDRVASFVRSKQGPTVAELEEQFDPDDSGDR
ncbi:hypothetical protein [Yoonia sp. SDW83-1]|uniref:hypothetical protein n=1 Tax=Yoonia sp. SDW83-1 TaxID=3366945 RepID=UPI00398C734F